MCPDGQTSFTNTVNCYCRLNSCRLKHQRRQSASCILSATMYFFFTLSLNLQNRKTARLSHSQIKKTCRVLELFKVFNILNPECVRSEIMSHCCKVDTCLHVDDEN